MILPIASYGNSVLKTEAEEIEPGYPELPKLLADMFETMYAAKGVGLAAPQVNLSLRLFIVDAEPFDDEYPGTAGFRRVFINPVILERSGEEVMFEEGCLSFPGIREEILRPDSVRIRYRDENFTEHEETWGGIISRIIQHEYDHIDGVLMVDHMSTLRKMVMKRRLKELTMGLVKADYKMLFPKLVKK